MVSLRFDRELNTNVEPVLDELAVFLRGRKARLLIHKRDTLDWVLAVESDIYQVPVLLTRMAREWQTPLEFKPDYYVYRLLTSVDKKVQIGGMIISQFERLPWEKLTQVTIPFTIQVSIDYQQPVPFSLEDVLVQVEIATDRKEIAEMVASWVGGYVGEKIAPTFFYDQEIKYLIRPPVSEVNYFAGGILTRSQTIQQQIRFAPEILLKHTLICGMSGSGKTNTTRLILDEVIQSPNLKGFLLIDIKGEYQRWATRRAVKYMEVGKFPRLLKTLKINPFIPPEEITLITHVDHLAQIFAVSSFGGAGLVLPYYIKMVLYEFFKELWKLSDDQFNNVLYMNGQELRERNFRFYFTNPDYTLLNRLVAFWKNENKKVMATIFAENTGKQLGDISGIVSARMQSLSRGLLQFFDYSPAALSMQHLIDQKVVLSFQGASDDQINFLASLFALLYITSLNTQGDSHTLTNLLVVEEAHRIMGSVNPSVEVLNSASELSRLMENAISELRSKGAGVVIIDQNPSRLIPGVIVNTGTKIIHRLPHQPNLDMLLRAVGYREEIDLSMFRDGECLLQTDQSLVQHIQMDEWTEN